jgi:hypothetical protein
VFTRKEIRKAIREVLKESQLQERIKIKRIEKNPKEAEHDVTVYAEISPSDERELKSRGLQFARDKAAIKRGDHDRLKKDVVLQGNYLKDSHGMNRLRLKFYDIHIPDEYQRIPDITQQQQLQRLRSENPDEFIPYDETGDQYPDLRPDPPEKKKKAATKKKRKRRDVSNTSNAGAAVEEESSEEEESFDINLDSNTIDLLGKKIRKLLLLSHKNKKSGPRQACTTMARMIVNQPLKSHQCEDIISMLNNIRRAMTSWGVTTVNDEEDQNMIEIIEILSDAYKSHKPDEL